MPRSVLRVAPCSDTTNGAFSNFIDDSGIYSSASRSARKPSGCKPGGCKPAAAVDAAEDPGRAWRRFAPVCAISRAPSAPRAAAETAPSNVRRVESYVSALVLPLEQPARAAELCHPEQT